MYKYGIGHYRIIVRRKLLPGKYITQMPNQLRRIIGKLSVREYSGLRGDIYEIGKKNYANQKGKFLRKDFPIKKEDFIKRRVLNFWRYGKSYVEVMKLKIPLFNRRNTEERCRNYLDWIEKGEVEDDLIFPFDSNDHKFVEFLYEKIDKFVNNKEI